MHYDGAGILFITDSSGGLAQAKVETLADIWGNGQLTVLDRDFGNQYVSKHDNTFYGGIWLGSTIYGNKDTPPTSIAYVFWGSTNDTSCRSTYQGTSCDRAGAFEYGRLEGFNYGALTFQGARAVDSSTGLWTTPDAYAGAVHDPLSQKAFMWDRNNPYVYSDPTGFSPQAVTTADVNGGILAFAGAAPGDALPTDPSGLDPRIWTPDNPDPSKTGRGSGGQWFYNSQDKTWVRFDHDAKRGDHWHFFTTNDKGPKTPGGKPAPQNPVKVNGDRHLPPGAKPPGFRNHFGALDIFRRVIQDLLRPAPFPPCCPIVPPAPVVVPI